MLYISVKNQIWFPELGSWLQQPIGSTIVGKKEPNPALQPHDTVDVTTNVYQIKMKAPTRIHQYHVLITGHHLKQDGTETAIQLSGLQYTKEWVLSFNTNFALARLRVREIQSFGHRLFKNTLVRSVWQQPQTRYAKGSCTYDICS